MLRRNSPVPLKFILTIIALIVVFVPLSGYLMREFPGRGEGITPAEWFTVVGFAAILVFGAAGTIWYQCKGIRNTRRVPGQPVRRRSALDRTGAITGTVIYGGISIIMLATVVVTFTVRSRLPSGEVPIFMVLGFVIAAGTGFTAWMKWRGPVNYSNAVSTEPAQAETPFPAGDPDTQKLFRIVRLNFALIACSIIGFLGAWAAAGIIWLIGGDAAVSHYTRPPWAYIEYLLPAIIASPFASLRWPAGSNQTARPKSNRLR